MLKPRDAQADANFGTLYRSFLTGEIRNSKGSAWVFDNLLRVLPEQNDPAAIFAIVTNLSYRIAEDQGRQDAIGQVQGAFIQAAQDYRNYVACRRSLRWGISAIATLPSLHILRNAPKDACDAINAYDENRVLAIWDIDNACPSHVNSCTYLFNRATLSIYNEDMDGALACLDQLTAKIPLYYAELSANANVNRLHHMFDLRGLHNLYMRTLPMHYLVSKTVRGSYFSHKNIIDELRPQMLSQLYHRFDKAWLKDLGIFQAVHGILAAGA